MKCQAATISCRKTISISGQAESSQCQHSTMSAIASALNNLTGADAIVNQSLLGTGFRSLYKETMMPVTFQMLSWNFSNACTNLSLPSARLFTSSAAIVTFLINLSVNLSLPWIGSSSSSAKSSIPETLPLYSFRWLSEEKNLLVSFFTQLGRVAR